MPGRLPDALASWAPRWWAGEAGRLGLLADVALAPAEVAYRAVLRARNLAYDRGMVAARRAPIPVVSVGNLAVGGSGKTPFAAWLARRLTEHGARPAVVMRGYGADELAVHRELNPDVPVYAAPLRLVGVARAAEDGATVAVLDDGFQHRALARDLDVALVAAEHWAGNRRLLPRGPWREPRNALRRADLVVVTAKTAADDEVDAVGRAVATVAGERPVLRCRLLPAGVRPLHEARARAAPELGGMQVLAVAGLADPSAFGENVAGLGAEVELAAFADHHAYTARDADALVRRAAGRPIVMTRKDAVKLRALLPPAAAAWVLEQRLVFPPADERVILERVLAAAGKGAA